MDLETIITGIGGVIAAVSAWFWSAKKTTKDLRAQDLANDGSNISNTKELISLYKDALNEWDERFEKEKATYRADNEALHMTLKECDERHQHCEESLQKAKEELYIHRVSIAELQVKNGIKPIHEADTDQKH